MLVKNVSFYIPFVVRIGLFLFGKGTTFAAAVTFSSGICAHLDNCLLPTSPSVSGHIAQFCANYSVLNVFCYFHI